MELALREGPGGVLHRGHRMALFVKRRGVRGRRSGGAGAARGLPGLWPADGALVWLRALPAPGPGASGVGAPGQVPALPRDPRLGAVVRAAPAAGCGRGDRCRVGAGGGRCWPSPGGCRPRCAAHDRSGLAAAVPRSCPALAVGLAALVVELGGAAPALPAGSEVAALAALGAAAWQVRYRAGALAPTRWRLGAVVTGGGWLATTTSPPWAGLGGRRWLPPVP